MKNYEATINLFYVKTAYIDIIIKIYLNCCVIIVIWNLIYLEGW